MKHRLFTVHISLFTCLAAMAQLNNTVEVTNEVKPVVTDAKKVDVKTQAVQTQVKHYTMQYATEGQPTTNYAEEPVGDYATEEVVKGNKKGYVHLGGGTHGQLDGSASYQFNLTEDDALGVSLMLQGFDGKVRNNNFYGIKDWRSRDYRNRAAVKYNHHIERGADVYARGAFENRVFNYMGGTNYTDKQHNVLGTLDFGLMPYQVEDLMVEAKGGVDFFSQNYQTSLTEKLGETLVHLDLVGAYQFTEQHQVGLGLGFFSSSYGNAEFEGITSLRLSPYYQFVGKQLSAQVGFFASTSGEVGPDAWVSYRIDPQSEVYVKASSYETDNSFQRYAREHPYFAFSDDLAWSDKSIIKMKAEYHQIDVSVGYRIKSINGFSAHLNAGLDMVKNKSALDWMSIAQNGRYMPCVEFAKRRNFYINADFSYAYGDILKVEAKNQINMVGSKIDDEWVKGSFTRPVFMMDWTADAKVTKGLYVGLDWDFAIYDEPLYDYELIGASYERPNMLNLGASIRYTLPVKLPCTLFVKGDNLFDCKYDRYWGYRQMGVNVLGGVALSF